MSDGEIVKGDRGKQKSKRGRGGKFIFDVQGMKKEWEKEKEGKNLPHTSLFPLFYFFQTGPGG